MSTLTPGQHVHLVGIGGAGLSAIARVLLGQGYRVSGSDRSLNTLTAALVQDGAHIIQGHTAANVTGADVLIITSAVQSDHVEVAAAMAAGIPVYKRQDIMADLMRGQRIIAVAGTKGKTTTTAMIAHILLNCGRDPSYIVGGVLGSTGDNARVGAGGWFVVEADEYDNMFLGLRPDVAVITNIEWDHPDFFPTPQAMIESFRRFAALLPEDGLLLTGEGTPLSAVTPITQERYGLTDAVPDWRIHNLRYEDSRQVFEVMQRGQSRGTAQLGLPGAHNALNALAALAVTHHAGVPFAEAAAALASFKPAARRFELRAEIDDIAIVDDYAHNPMSIRAVLDAARQRYPGRALWAVWQPHTYSRTQALFADFVTAFAAADHVLITDIYAAREEPLPSVGSAALVTAMQHPDVRHTASFDETVAALRDGVRAPAVVLIMSAGDAPQIGIAYEHLLRGQS